MPKPAPTAESSLAFPERPDVFVSYSRKDAGFVERLHSGLADRGKEVWVDWEDIGKGAMWRERIQAGIEAAAAVVAVLSPDFARSEVCSEEIEHAFLHGKRVVPLLRRELGGVPVLDGLAARNWIFFREGDDFDSALTELVEAIDTDQDWVDRHARLLVRAREWETSGRDSAFLLHGSDLGAAESWLAEQGSHRERATPLQAEYVVASRRASSRRQRLALLAVLVALAVSIGLGILALLQRGEARHQRDQARAQRDLATSRLLASKSSANAGRVDLSALVGLEAWRTSPTVEARSATLSALQQLQQVRAVLRYPDSTTPADVLAFSEDGRVLAAGHEGRVVLWDVPGRRPIGRPLSVGAEQLIVGHSRLAILGTSGDGSGSSAISLWELTNGRPSFRRLWKRVPGLVSSIALSRDGRLLAAALNSGEIRLWSAADGRLLRPVRDGWKTFMFPLVSFGPGRGTLTSVEGWDLVREMRPAITVWGLPKREPRSRLYYGRTGSTIGASYSRDGRHLALAPNEAVQVWNVARGRVAYAPKHVPHTEVTALSADGRRLAVIRGTTVSVFALPGFRPVDQLRGISAASVTFGADRHTLAIGGWDGAVYLWTLEPEGKAIKAIDPFPNASYLEDVSVDDRGVMVGAAHFLARGSGFAWSLQNRRLRTTRALLGGISEIAVSAGSTVALAGLDGVTLWNRNTGRMKSVPGTRSESVSSFAFDPAGRFLLWAGDFDTIHAHTLGSVSSRVVATSPVLGDISYVNQLSFSRNGRRLVSHTRHVVEVWDVGHDARGRVRVELPRSRRLSQGVDGATFTDPGGDTVLIVTRDAVVQRWKVGTAGWASRLRLDTDTLHDFAVSPDSTMLAASAGDGVELWDLASGNRIGRPIRQGETRSLAFSPSGRTLVAAGADPGLLLIDSALWSKDWATVRKQICAIVPRNLTPTEWRTYVSGSAYHPTCGASR